MIFRKVKMKSVLQYYELRSLKLEWRWDIKKSSLSLILRSRNIEENSKNFVAKMIVGIDCYYSSTDLCDHEFLNVTGVCSHRLVLLHGGERERENLPSWASPYTCARRARDTHLTTPT